MSLPEILLGVGAVVTVLIQGFKTVPFIKNNTWIAFPISLILGFLCTLLFVNIGQAHFLFNSDIIWIGLSVGLISGGYYAGSTSTGSVVASLVKTKAPSV